MQKVDIAIAGSGIACTATLIELFRKLIDDGPDQPTLSITVFEKSHEFWYGVPYGSRSSVNALTITSVYDFFTAEHEREGFFAWFKVNKKDLLAYYLENGGETARQWMKKNGVALENEDFKNVYLPRFMCGRYTQSKFESLLDVVVRYGMVELNLITAEVINVSPKSGDYEVTYEMVDKTVLSLTAAKVVIATGSAPVKDIILPEGNSSVTLINNLYEPFADENIRKITEALKASKSSDERNILLIGSNASSIELLYLLAGLPKLTGLINKLVVVSKSGALPYAIVDKTLDNYPTENLDRLKAKGKYDIKALIDAAMRDLKIAVQNGVIIPYIDRVIGYTIELLQPLDEIAKKEFLGIYGMQLSNQFRRSGSDYKSGEAFLLDIQKLIMLKGSFLGVEPTENGGLLRYFDSNAQEQMHADNFKVIINLTGANDLNRSSSRLLYSLVNDGIAQVNLSGKGFYVNEKFEAAPNLYVMGPLLGGNKNDRIHFWHLENASRIMYLAPYLADCLLEKVEVLQ